MDNSAPNQDNNDPYNGQTPSRWDLEWNIDGRYSDPNQAINEAARQHARQQLNRCYYPGDPQQPQYRYPQVPPMPYMQPPAPYPGMYQNVTQVPPVPPMYGNPYTYYSDPYYDPYVQQAMALEHQQMVTRTQSLQGLRHNPAAQQRLRQAYQSIDQSFNDGFMNRFG